MRVGRVNFTGDYGLVADGVAFDPATMLMAGSMAATAAGTAISAGGTIAGGTAAMNAAKFQAAQLNENSAGAVAASQRTMLDTQLKTKLLQSTATARAGASGVNAGVGSPVSDVGQIARRGSYLAASDLFKGMNTATGLRNESEGVIYSGESAQKGSELSALATIAGGAGSMAQMYGRFAYPTSFGNH